MTGELETGKSVIGIFVGTAIGIFEGDIGITDTKGALVGASIGEIVCDEVGASVSVINGTFVGNDVGIIVGEARGLIVLCIVGVPVGDPVCIQLYMNISVPGAINSLQ